MKASKHNRCVFRRRIRQSRERERLAPCVVHSEDPHLDFDREEVEEVLRDGVISDFRDIP
jgi:uncharacterized protein YabE (DUF348 family)